MYLLKGIFLSAFGNKEEYINKAYLCWIVAYYSAGENELYWLESWSLGFITEDLIYFRIQLQNLFSVP